MVVCEVVHSAPRPQSETGGRRPVKFIGIGSRADGEDWAVKRARGNLVERAVALVGGQTR